MFELLSTGRKVALLMHDSLAGPFGKMGIGMLRYSQADVVAIIDKSQAGKQSNEFISAKKVVPVVGTVEEAQRLGAESVLIGIAPPGGLLPEDWRNHLMRSLDLGMAVINPLHEKLSVNLAFAGKGKVWDVRVEPENLQPATGAARHLNCKRILTVGTDMSVGKMTACLEIVRELNRRKASASMVATGQVGICITGRGIALDAVRVDFAAGAVERELISVANGAEIVMVEGQGALCHPAATANLALIRGSMPTHLVLCARARQTHIRNATWAKIPNLQRLFDLYSDLTECCGCFQQPVQVGIALNTSELDEIEAVQEIESLENESGLPITDPVRFGCDKLCDAILK